LVAEKEHVTREEEEKQRAMSAQLKSEHGSASVFVRLQDECQTMHLECSELRGQLERQERAGRYRKEMGGRETTRGEQAATACDT
jgi:hypothetical protein